MTNVAPASSPVESAVRAASLRAAALSAIGAAIIVASLGYAVVSLQSDERVIAALRSELSLQKNSGASTLKNSKGAASDQIGKLQQDNANLRTRAGALSHQLDAAGQDVKTLEQKLDSTRLRLHAANNTIGNLNKELTGANGKISVLKGDMASANQTNEELQKTCASRIEKLRVGYARALELCRAGGGKSRSRSPKSFVPPQQPGIK